MSRRGSVTTTPVVLRITDDLTSVALHPPAGVSGKVEFTISGIRAVQQGVADWFDWPKGTVSVSTIDAIDGKVSAIRIGRSSGSAALEYEVLP